MISLRSRSLPVSTVPNIGRRNFDRLHNPVLRRIMQEHFFQICGLRFSMPTRNTAWQRYIGKGKSDFSAHSHIQIEYQDR